jgi:hypothetical protein
MFNEFKNQSFHIVQVLININHNLVLLIIYDFSISVKTTASILLEKSYILNYKCYNIDFDVTLLCFYFISLIHVTSFVNWNTYRYCFLDFQFRNF